MVAPGQIGRIGRIGLTPLSLGKSLEGMARDLGVYEMWDATKPDALTLSGGLVSAWASLITGLAPTQGVSSLQPAWSATGFNSKSPGVTFDGTDDELVANAIGGMPINADPCEIIILSSPLANTGSRSLFVYGGTGSLNRRQQMIINGGTFARETSANIGGATPTTVQNNQANFVGPRVSRLVVGAGGVSLGVDGLVTGPTSYASTPATTNTRTKIGATNSASSSFFAGAVSAILVMPLLNDLQFAALDAKLRERI